jgi:branched-subunit amino acid transport protein
MSTSILTAPCFKAERADAGDSFVVSIFICMLLIALPIKNSAYLVAPIFIGLQALLGNYAFVRRAVLWSCLAVCLSAISVAIDALYGQGVNLPGLVVGMLTYAPLAVILALRSDFAITPERRLQLTTAVAWFVIFESILGMAQFAASHDPDTVCGTFGLLDFRGSITIGQVYLTFNLFAMILFLLTDMRRALPKVAVVLGLLACALAHSGHQTIFFLASLAIVGLLQMRFVDALKLGVIMIALGVATASLSSIYWSDIEGWYRKAAQDADSPKKMATLSAVEILSYPKNLLMGVGMGQYGSRAALITSGTYLTVELPRMFVDESEYYRTYILPAHYQFLDHGENSAMSKPYYSVMNLVVEFGVPLAGILAFATLLQFLSNRQLSRSGDNRLHIVGTLANVGLVFFVLCACIENYVEFPQAIFLPALLYVAARATANSPGEDEVVVLSAPTKRGCRA